MTTDTGIHFLRRSPVPPEVARPQLPTGPLLVALLAGAVLGAGLMYLLRRDRYQVMTILRDTTVVRLDKFSGELDYFNTQGQLISKPRVTIFGDQTNR